MVYADEDIWLTQKMMGVLYDVKTPTINYHLKNIFADHELTEDSVIRKFRITAADGKNYDTGHYSLSAIIAVGYKVNSERAVQFRKWATTVVKEYTVKGFAMDDDRSATATQRFFAVVQNKLHWAIHGHTAAEVIVDRADAGKQHMGLTSWKDAPHGKIQKFDVSVAKNYLTEPEMAQLSRLVNAYLDVAEDTTHRATPLWTSLALDKGSPPENRGRPRRPEPFRLCRCLTSRKTRGPHETRSTNAGRDRQWHAGALQPQC